MGYLSLIQPLPGLREHHGRGNRKKSLRAGDSSLPQILKGWTSQQNLITSKSDWPAKGGRLTLYGFVLYGQCLPFLPLRRTEIAMSTSQGFWIVTVITQGVMSYPPSPPQAEVKCGKAKWNTKVYSVRGLMEIQWTPATHGKAEEWDVMSTHSASAIYQYGFRYRTLTRYFA